MAVNWRNLKVILPSKLITREFLNQAFLFVGRVLPFLLCGASAVSAALLLFLGKDKIGGTPIAPGFDTGFTWKTKTTPETKVLQLRTHEGGELSCWLRLKPMHSISNQSALTASLVGQTLEVTASKDEDFPDWIDVYQPEKAANERGKFKWSNGHMMEISCHHDATRSLELTDWLIYMDKDNDSLANSKRRWWLFWGSIVALVLSIPATLFTGWNLMKKKDEKTAQIVTSQSIVISVIDAIGLDDRIQEKKMKLLLSQVLIQGLSVNAAIGGMTFKDDKEKFAFWFNTRRQFRERLSVIIHELTDYFNKTR